jgi:hypothetical protein
LLCCDDLDVAVDMIGRFPATPGPRNLALRRLAVLRWAWSEAYVGLRRELGIAIG